MTAAKVPTFLMRGELRLKNARLVRTREEMGMKQAEFARFLKIQPSSYCAYENMRVYPCPAHAERMAAIAGCSVEELFPEELRSMEKGGVPRMAVEIPVPTTHLLGMGRRQPLALAPSATPDRQVDMKKLGHSIMEAIACLTPMEARILKMRFGLDGEDEQELNEIGRMYNLSRERVRQLQEQALAKIRRHPAIAAHERDGTVIDALAD